MAQIIDFNQITDLKEYADNQYRTILTLQADKEALMAEVAHLQELLSKMVMPVKSESRQLNLNVDEDTPSEVVAAMCQIELLREKASSMPLEFSETKSLEVHSKIVHTYRLYKDTKDKKASDLLPSLTEDELLDMLK